jgi:hypothetical protein
VLNPPQKMMPAKKATLDMANIEYLALGFRMKAMNLEMRPVGSDMFLPFDQLKLWIKLTAIKLML